jgi:hypothetical protein
MVVALSLVTHGSPPRFVHTASAITTARSMLTHAMGDLLRALREQHVTRVAARRARAVAEAHA